jgi:hypothetical protein
MTFEQYIKATKILEEKEFLEKKLQNIRDVYRVDFVNLDEYNEICEKLFALGLEFAAL